MFNIKFNNTALKLIIVKTILISKIIFAQTLTTPVDIKLTPGVDKDRAMHSTGQFHNVDTYNGALKFAVTDLVLPGNGGLDIQITRTYDSSRVNEGDFSGIYKGGIQFLKSNLANGWALHFGRLYAKDESNFCYNGSTGRNGEYGAVLELANGETSSLIKSSTLNQPGLFSNGWKIDCNVNIPGEIYLNATDGTIYVFGNKKSNISESVWYLTRISKFNQNITIVYNNSYIYSLHPELSYISTTDGRNISFVYANSGFTVNGTNNTSTNHRQLTQFIVNGKTYQYQFTNLMSWSGTYLSKVFYPGSNSNGEFEYNYSSNTLSGQTCNSTFIDRCYNKLLTSLSIPYNGINSPSTNLMGYVYNETIDCTGRNSAKIFRVYDMIPGGIYNGTLNTYYDYVYTSGITNSFPVDITTVINSNDPNYKISYHYINQNINSNQIHLIGKLTRKTIPTYETVDYKYTSQLISNRPNHIKNNCIAKIDTNGTYSSLISERAITRYTKIANQASTANTIYMTVYSNFNQFGLPQTIIETNLGNNMSRTTTKSYYNNTSTWVIGLESNVINNTTNTNKTYTNNGLLLNYNINGVQTKYTYTTSGDKATMITPNGHLYTYKNHYRGKPQLEIQPAGIQYIRTYDYFGNITSENFSGALTTYNYNPSTGLLQTITPSLGQTISVSHSAHHWAKGITLNRGGYSEIIKLDHTGAIELTSRNSGADKMTSSRGRNHLLLAEESLVSLNSSNQVRVQNAIYQHDPLDRIINEKSNYKSNASYVTYSYEQIGGFLHITKNSIYNGNPTANRIKEVYYSYGDPDEKYLVEKYIGSNLNNRILINRNSKDLISAVTNNNVMRQYTYDSRNYLSSIIDNEVNIVYQRDDMNNIVSESRNNSTPIVFTYNGQNKMLSKTSGLITYYMQYTNRNKLASLQGGGVSRLYTYNLNDDITIETLNNYNIEYTYNNLNQLTSLKYPSGTIVNYLRTADNKIGQVIKSNNPIASFVNYYGNTLYGYTNGFQAGSVTIDIAPHILTQTQIQYPSSVNLNFAGLNRKVSYLFDNNFNLNKISSASDPIYNTTLYYDDTHRLIKYDNSSALSNFAYSPNNNLLSRTLNGFSTLYSYSGHNRLLNSTGQYSGTFTQDILGNIINDGVYTYQYDTFSNMICARCNNPAQVQYFKYDGLGDRVSQSKIISTGTMSENFEFVNYLGNLMYEHDVSTGLYKEHYYLDNVRIAQNTVLPTGIETLTYIVSDYQKSPLFGVTKSGSTPAVYSWSEKFTAFGTKQINSVNAMTNSIGFLGYRQDSQTGFVFDGNTYNPFLGRYMSIKNTSFSPTVYSSLNRYSFKNNNVFSISNFRYDDIYTISKPLFNSNPWILTGRNLNRLDSFYKILSNDYLYLQ